MSQMSPPTRPSTVHVRSAHGAEPNQRSITQPNSAPPAIVPEKLMPRAVYHPARTNGLDCATQSGACRGKQGERRERTGERERLAQRRSTTRSAPGLEAAKDFPCRADEPIDVALGVCQRAEHRIELRRRQVDALLQIGVDGTGKEGGIRAPYALVIATPTRP